MDQIIQQVSQKLSNQLPEDQTHYRLDELRAFGLPDFIKDRIRIELEHKLSESIQLPETDWADMEGETVRSLWAQFVHAVRQEAHLPAASAGSILHTAVTDVLNMLVCPREKLPDIIFRDDAELGYDQITDRLEGVVVYRHFATLIPRYMQKKSVQKLSKERCAAIIERADERLTQRYTPLNWAQMLEPLFQLLNQKIDPELLTLFFKDKNKPRLAKQFEALQAPVDRSGFIELLSSPDSLNLYNPKGGQDELQNSESSEESNNDRDDRSKIGDGEPRQRPGVSAQKPKNSKANVGPGEDPIVGAFHKFRASLQEKEEKSGIGSTDTFSVESNEQGQGEVKNGTSLNDSFQEQEDVDDDVELKKDEKEHDISGSTSEDLFEDESSDPNISDDEQIVDDGSEVVESVFRPLNTNEDTPMWKRFLSPEELKSLEEGGEVSDAVKTEQRDAAKEHEILKDELSDDRSYFIEKLFSGSEQAYSKALADIAGCDDWRSASKYISENVFKRNLVDMYSEAAVEFTDRLHTYFRQKSNS